MVGVFGLRVAEFAGGVIRLAVILHLKRLASASSPSHPTRRRFQKLFLWVAWVSLRVTVHAVWGGSSNQWITVTKGIFLTFMLHSDVCSDVEESFD